jgi:predicted HTH transcriptional regulator
VDEYSLEWAITKILGFGEDVKAKITDMIEGNCEPSIKVQVNQVTFQGSIPITIVEVPEGEKKPYILNNTGIFVRRGSSDRQIKRSELDEIYTKNKS